MKIIRVLIVTLMILAACAPVFGMGGKPVAGRGVPTVAVSIVPQAYFVGRIAGDRIRVITLVGPGQNPHSYEPTPRQMADLSTASLWFTVGVEFENALLPKVASLYPGIRLVDTISGIRFRSLEGKPYNDDGDNDGAIDADHDEGGRDPHVWLGHESVKIQVGHILNALLALDPAGASVYRNNRDAFIREIDTLFNGLAAELVPLRGKPAFVYHPSFGYFLDEFGIVQEAVETGGKEPTQKGLAALIGRARADGARVIFVQPQFPVSAAGTVAAAIGGSVVQIDALAADWLLNIKIMADALRAAVR
ncbi:MAG: metal ABC transporter substrate-binding protein [Spirochaetales bacterium]|nr:MAG: metal ABC transporter substrate-binding protein [Spirochaetales bacterium]